MQMETNEKLIIALDVYSLEEMNSIVDAIGDLVVYYKVGHQL